MNLHSLHNTEGARHRKRRVGRGDGSGLGHTAGRGHKGQMARTGATHREAFEGGQTPLIRRIPKRGFNHTKKVQLAPINVASLAIFEAGTEVDFELAKAAGLANGCYQGMKILGDGELAVNLVVKANGFSKSAKEKIEAAGGSCEVTS